MSLTFDRQRVWFLFLLVVAGGSWGLFFALARIASEGGHHPFGLTFWQGVGGGLLLLSIAAIRRTPLPLNPRAIGFYLICGVFGTTLPTGLIFYVAPNIGAGLLAITMTLVPIMTYGASIMLGIDKPAALRLGGLALGFVAILMIMWPSIGAEGGVALLWALLALLVPACFTIENLLLALRGPKGIDPISLVGTFQLCGALLMLPVALATDNFMDITGVWNQSHWASVLMFMINALSYTVFLYVLQHTGPVFASQATYVATITGILWGMVLFGETHAIWIWLALFVLMAGMALVQERKAERGS